MGCAVSQVDNFRWEVDIRKILAGRGVERIVLLVGDAPALQLGDSSLDGGSDTNPNATLKLSNKPSKLSVSGHGAGVPRQ